MSAWRKPLGCLGCRSRNSESGDGGQSHSRGVSPMCMAYFTSSERGSGGGEEQRSKGAEERRSGGVEERRSGSGGRHLMHDV